MKFEISREAIRITPESDIDETYLEEVLGLKTNGATCTAERVDGLSFGSWAYMKIYKQK